MICSVESCSLYNQPLFWGEDGGRGGRGKAYPTILLGNHVTGKCFCAIWPIIGGDFEALPPVVAIAGYGADGPHHLNWVGAGDEQDLIWRGACCGVGEGEQGQ
jgi:hypothetical protein